MIRVGQGYDIHGLETGRALIIGGIEIPYSKGLVGVTDADVLVHSIIDALLGACNLGDIGSVFPESDSRIRGISSLVLLEETCDKIHSKGFTIGNIDCTISAEAPKMSEFIDLMKVNISQVCKIDIDVISIKATTMEQFDAIGQKKAIAAMCVCLVENDK